MAKARPRASVPSRAKAPRTATVGCTQGPIVSVQMLITDDHTSVAEARHLAIEREDGLDDLRKARTVKEIFTWAVLVMAALTTVQCGRTGVSEEKLNASPSKGSTTVIPFHTLAKGVHSAITRPRQVAIRTDGDWRQLWSEHVAGLAPSPPLPRVDFRTHMVIAVFRGNTEGGFPIEITEINTRPHELIVFFTMLSPPPGFPLGVGVVRQPYHIVRVERLSLPVVFQEKS